VHGSINATESAFSDNFEQVAVNRSWESDSSKKVVTKIDEMFEKIWSGTFESIKTVSLNKNTINYLHKVYESLDHNQVTNVSLMNDLADIIMTEESVGTSPSSLKIPEWLNYTTGNFSHQEKAVNAWFENNGRGILSIATGGGKTLTALIAATLVANKEKSLLVVIAVPTIALINQWADDVKDFCIEPLNSQIYPKDQLGKVVNGCVRRLRFGASQCEVIIATHEGLKSDRFLKLLEKAETNTTLMLIGDEVHNLGSIGFQNAAPNIFRYRLGLSATFERQFDDDGTQFLLDYFGKVVFNFDLKDAIGVCLVPFNYYVHLVPLNENEEDEWSELTYEIKRLSYAVDLPDGANEKERWKTLCLKRRRIVESAEGKILALAKNLPDNKDNIKRTLIFCTDKYPEQLTSVNELLINRYVNFHQITAEETSNKKLLKTIINEFDLDNLQVLTSKRVLDEGFNIPQTETAYLLASNTVKRQWIQRLGRVLRTSKSTNKVKAIIHDFVVIPMCEDGKIDIDLKSLLRGELRRIQFFDSLSKNGLEKSGTAEIVEKLLELME
jgi:superfamily II DNA or RNA helicase